MVKISDCPFCGSSATLICEPLWHGSHGYHGCHEVYVQCTNDKCRVTLPFGIYNSIYIPLEDAEKQAIDKWNNRKDKI